ncbi:MAG: hypothetical protein IKG18_15800, partial [Atopobiaceae bacterium]|nr:hypothetical protein [Atopobiaceae bacterium]
QRGQQLLLQKLIAGRHAPPEAGIGFALAALRGEQSTSAGVSRAFALVAAEAGLEAVEVSGADGSAWCMVNVDGAWRHVNPAAALGASDASWLMLTDEEFVQAAPDAAPWALADGGEAPKAEVANEANLDGAAQQEDSDASDAQQEPEERPDEEAEQEPSAKEAEAAEEERSESDDAELAKGKSAEKQSQTHNGKSAKEQNPAATKSPAGLEAQAAVGSYNRVTINAIADKTYTGSAIKPKPKVILEVVVGSAGTSKVISTSTLEEGRDYTLSYTNNVNVGTATVIVTGSKYMSGTWKRSFKIKAASITKAKVAGIANKAYTGKAIKPSPKVTYNGKTLKKGTDYTVSYTNNTKAGTATVIIKGKGNFTGTTKKTFKIVAPTVQYKVHRQTYGWESGWKKNGQQSGTTGESKRLEAIYVKLGANFPVTGGIRYKTHIQGIGWENSWKSNGKLSGTSGQSKRLEAIRIELTGNMKSKYDVFYRVHAQQFGWMGWAKNGADAGTAGYSYRLEAIQIVVLPKGSKAPGSTYKGATQATKGAFKQRDNTRPVADAYNKALDNVDAWAFSNDTNTSITPEYGYYLVEMTGDNVPELLVAKRVSWSDWHLRFFVYDSATRSAKLVPAETVGTGGAGIFRYYTYRDALHIPSDGHALMHTGIYGSTLSCERCVIVGGRLQTSMVGQYPADGSVTTQDLGYTRFDLTDVSNRTAINGLRM